MTYIQPPSPHQGVGVRLFLSPSYPTNACYMPARFDCMLDMLLAGPQYVRVPQLRQGLSTERLGTRLTRLLSRHD